MLAFFLAPKNEFLLKEYTEVRIANTNVGVFAFNQIDQVETTFTRLFVNIKESEFIRRRSNYTLEIATINNFIAKLQELFNESKVDEAILYTFRNSYTWKQFNRFFYEMYFKTLKGKKFNEDLYVAILSSTIHLKNISQRASYFQFVYEELINQGVDKNEVDDILFGL